ncbi:laminin-like protein [Acrasis kona]|uniref:Laminin-like protein n=1 Tax=Acrasis kona TaxID=1008807 RepID=A0AAW2YLK0_9EUKA
MIVKVYVFEISYRDNYSETERFNLRVNSVNMLKTNSQLDSWSVGGATKFFQVAVKSRTQREAKEAILDLIRLNTYLKEIHHQYLEPKALDDSMYATNSTVEILSNLFSNLPDFQDEDEFENEVEADLDYQVHQIDAAHQQIDLNSDNSELHDEMDDEEFIVDQDREVEEDLQSVFKLRESVFKLRESVFKLRESGNSKKFYI